MNAQINKIDSLNEYTYRELVKKFSSSKDSKELYAKYYLSKAKNSRDTLRIAKGYKLITFIVTSDIAIKYSDSIIKISKGKPYKSYPAEGYLLKAYYLYQKGSYKDALDNYIKALPLAKERKNTKQLFRIRQGIGTLKSRFGNYNEALRIYKEDLNFIQTLTNYKVKYKKDYLSAIFNISNIFLKTKNLDSAKMYLEKGISESLTLKDTVMYYDFVTASGYEKYYSNDFTEALRILNLTAPHLKGYSLGVSYYYKGKCYQKLGSKEKMLHQFKKADSIYQLNKDLFPELRNIYEFFIDHYKEKKKTKQQLYYLEKLISIDSILDKQYNYLSSEIVKKYDTPLLLNEQERLKNEVESLNKQNMRSNFGLGISLVFISIIAIFLIYYYEQQKKYKRKFIETINKSKKENEEKERKEKSEVDKKDLGISKEIINEILQKLNEFEANNIFLKSDITVASLAKDFNTNTTYLSKIINVNRGKNFSSYLKELRVNYAIEQLQNNSQFRKYSVKAIAYEIGFNNVDYFSKAFYKITGIQPSYFIKQLEKQENKE
ncbi:AraC family transcriptional regulator [Kordia algicida OT-1]|nr:AraC family transcriptional regulator [Kordia algicida]